MENVEISKVMIHQSQKFKQIKIEENEEVNKLVDTLGIKVKHFYDRDAWGPSLGGFAVAYHKSPRDSFVVLSTSVCSSQERYCRKIGKALAVDNFIKGKTVTLPVPKYITAPEVIQFYFGRNN